MKTINYIYDPFSYKWEVEFTGDTRLGITGLPDNRTVFPSSCFSSRSIIVQPELELCAAHLVIAVIKMEGVEEAESGRGIIAYLKTVLGSGCAAKHNSPSRTQDAACIVRHAKILCRNC